MSKPIGLILQDADLVSEAQINVALQDQCFCNDLRIGEILVLRGWLKQETADFFVQQWHDILNSAEKKPLGYYLEFAGLLNESQIYAILQEQQRLGVRFGAMAVLKGWIKPKTINFFLEHLTPQTDLKSSFIGKHSVDNLSKKTDFLITEAYIINPQITEKNQTEEGYDLAQALDDQLPW